MMNSTQLFTVFGLPIYIDSNHGTSVKSSGLKPFHHQLGVATSKFTLYNPMGNSQCKGFVDTRWKIITVALKPKILLTSFWEYVFIDALHCIWLLLCTTMDAAPHKQLIFYPHKTWSGQSTAEMHERNKDDPWWIKSTKLRLIQNVHTLGILMDMKILPLLVI